MGRRGTRKRIARGVYEDGTGRSGIYRDPVTGKPREVRFPPRTPVATIRAECDRRAGKAKGSGRASSARGTLAEGVDEWDPQERHLASYLERRAELRAWVALYGDRQRRSLEAKDVRAAMGTWTKAGLTPKTIRNRLWSLKHLYHVLDGPDAPTPVDNVTPPAKVRTIVQHVAPATILAVYQNLLEQERSGVLRDAKTRARFMVRAATGRRPVEIMRAQPDDVDLGRRTWRVRDAKGGWSEGLFLNDDMFVAWSIFAQANAWGAFDTGNMARVLRTAGWPDARDDRGRYLVRPYNLRHSVGIDLSEAGVDLADVGGWLGHTDVQTTRSAYVPILNSRMQRLSRQLEGRLGGWTSVPSSVPRFDLESLGTTWKHTTDARAVKATQSAQKPRKTRRKTG